MKINNVIGDYKEFFTNMVRQLDVFGISVKQMPISHLCYRTKTTNQYNKVREKLKAFAAQYVENEFNGRLITMFLLKDPLILCPGFETSLVELPAPRKQHTYPSGLEHIGIVVGSKLAAFKSAHSDILTGEKDRGWFSIPFITFPNGKTAKFYETSLKEIVQRDGWKFLPV